MDTGDDSLAAHLARGHDLPSARLVGGNQIELLEGGDQLFPSMLDAMARARSEVWLATYIFHDDAAGLAIAGSNAGGRG